MPNGSNSAVNVGGGGLSITTTTSNNNNNNAPVSPLIQDLINNNGGSPRRSSVGAFEQSRKPVRRLSSAQLFSMLSKPATPSTTSQKDVKEDTRITLSSRHVRQLKKHLNSLSELRQQMALLRQTFNTNNSDISCAMGEILKLTTDLREKAIKENEEDGRKLLLSAKSRLESQGKKTMPNSSDFFFHPSVLFCHSPYLLLFS